MSACNAKVAWETLVAYWADDLPAIDREALEEHVFGCPSCSAESARVATITETLRGMLPVLLSPERYAELQAEQRLQIVENPMAPGERREVPIPPVDLVVHRLFGLDLASATRVSFNLRAESSGRVLIEHPDAPFDRERGAVLLACQSHFAALPPDTVAEVSVHDGQGGETTTRYTILHRWG